MRVHGFCTKCKKVKRVNVSGLGGTGAVAMGVCDDCERGS